MTFWSQNNTLIIEILIGLILVMVVYMAFRSFFGEEAGEESTAGAPRSALDTAQLEKTLQRLIEQQKPAASAEAPAPAAAAAAGGGATSTTLGEGAAPAVTSEEATKLKADLAEREREIQELKKQSALASEAVSKGLNEEDKKKLEEKMKDLEARLAEYEIISEDIADLSFYKEENARLQKEMEELRKGAPDEAAPVEAVAPASLDAAAEAALAEMAAAAPAPEPVPEPEAPLTPPLPTDQKPSEDPALKEMAQVAATTEEKKPADELPPGEASQLMNQFENFVKKG